MPDRPRKRPPARIAVAAVCLLAAACGGTVSAEPAGGPPATSPLPLPVPSAGSAVSTSGAPSAAPAASPGPGAKDDPVVVAAGDISARCTRDGCGARETSDLVLRLGPTAVLALGDLQYPRGGLPDFRAYYDATWGRFKDRTRPAPGNHEYLTKGARGYFGYFGAAARPAGKSWYAFDLGEWHLISLDSTAPHGPGSEQLAWLTADLAAAGRRRCVLAFWHHPRFSSGRTHGGDAGVAPFWDALYAVRADVVLAGHEHNYERFEPLRPDGERAADGMREFVVGTGGASRYGFGRPVAGSAVRDAGGFGVLRLVLRSGGYEWRFVGTEGVVRDSGTARCH